MDIRVCIPSYRRPKACKVTKYIRWATIYCCETEADGYREGNPSVEIHAMPQGVQGHISRVRNYILDTNQGCDVLIMMDDDVWTIGGYEKKKRFKIPGENVRAWIEKYTWLAIEFGCKIWGLNLNSDYQCYREYTPFSLRSPILGPFLAVIMPFKEIRYDERFILKEDYDFCLQVLNRYRKILRLNKFHVDCDRGLSGQAKPGGCGAFRNLITEKKQFDLFRKKWGSKIVRVDRNERSHAKNKKSKKFDFNPVVHVPIGGV